MAEGMRGRLRTMLDVLKKTAAEFGGDHSPQVAAAMAYYTLFSIAPLLVLATALAGFVYGQGPARERILAQAASLAGPRVAEVLGEILTAASQPRSGLVATLIGAVTLVVGATGAFVSVQTALNQIWEVRPKPGRGFLGVLRDRVPGFLLLFVVGALLIVSLVASTWLAALADAVGDAGFAGSVVAQAGEYLLFVVVMSVLFAIVFKVLPDARVGWRDVWAGAVLTALLFAVGQLLIGMYLTYVSVGSAYGAAGSLIALLVWLNYSAQVFLFGAELTQVQTARRGSRIEPSRNAVRLQEPCTPPQPATGGPDAGRARPRGAQAGPLPQ